MRDGFSIVGPKEKIRRMNENSLIKNTTGSPFSITVVARLPHLLSAVSVSNLYIATIKKFENAINEIDKSIEHLQKMKSELLSSENNLRLANKKSEDLSIKMLTKNAPSIKVMFDELKRDGE